MVRSCPGKEEFARILKPAGWVVLIWNERRLGSTVFLRAYEDLLLRYGTDYEKVRHEKVTGEIAEFFSPESFELQTLENAQHFDFESLKGRLLSSSYAPDQDHPKFASMLKELEDIFDAHQKDGIVSFEYDTRIYYGHLNHSHPGLRSGKPCKRFAGTAGTSPAMSAKRENGFPVNTARLRRVYGRGARGPNNRLNESSWTTQFGLNQQTTLVSLARFQTSVPPKHNDPRMEMNLTKTAQRYGGMIELTLQKSDIPSAGDFSHANEQSILAKYIEKLLPKDQPKTVVDIGAGNGVRWSNSYALLLAGWKALGVEADPQKFALLSKVYGKFPHAQASIRWQRRTMFAPYYEISTSRRILAYFASILMATIIGFSMRFLANFRPGLVVTRINENIPHRSDLWLSSIPIFSSDIISMVIPSPRLKTFASSIDYGILELEYNNAFLAPRVWGGALSACEVRLSRRLLRQTRAERTICLQPGYGASVFVECRGGYSVFA